MSIATNSLRSSFGMLDAMLGANLSGVDARLAELRPSADANNARWVLGHVLYWRSRVLEMLGAEPVWGEADAPEFRGMKRGDPPAEVGRSFDEIVAGLAEARARTMAALERPLGEEQQADVLSLALHEAYHVGQLGMLRRAMGLSGAIGG